MSNQYFFYVVSLQLLVINYFDFKFKVISNWWPVMNLFLYLLSLVIIPNFFNLESLYFSIGFLLIGFLLFLFKIMGAGDVKYISSLFLLLPENLNLPFLTTLMTLTIIVGLFGLLLTIIQNRQKLLKGQFRGIFGKRKNIYAPIILIAWIWIGRINV